MSEAYKDPFHIETFRRTPLSEQERIIINVFANGVSGGPPYVAEAEFVPDLLCPSLDDSRAVEHYLWLVWDLMRDIARSPGITSETHILPVNVLEMLWQRAMGKVKIYGAPQRLWRDLPMMSDGLHNCLNASQRDVVGANASGTWGDAIHTIKSALEEQLDHNKYQPIKDTAITAFELKVQIACIWLFYAGKQFLWWAMEHPSDPFAMPEN